MTLSRSQYPRQQQQRRRLMLTAITALGSTTTRTTTSAFTPPFVPSSSFSLSSKYHSYAAPSSSTSSTSSLLLPVGVGMDRLSYTSPSVHSCSVHQTRMYGSKNRRTDDNNDDALSSRFSVTGLVKKVAKAVLPSSWTQSEEERQQAMIRKERKTQVKSGISTMLKDAPLGIRVLGSMVAPLLSNMASSLQEAQEQTEDLLDTARDYILLDRDVTDMLGEPIQVSTPFSQSTSMITMNGKTSSQVQAQFRVTGTRQDGIVTMMALDQQIKSLSLNVGGGRVMNISLLSQSGNGTNGRNRFSQTVDVFGSSSSSSSSYESKQQLGKNRINKDDIIDVEFVEKVERKP